MEITIIISYYKALDNLKLVLKALNNQSSIGFEVIVSEDDHNGETISYLKKNKHLYRFPIVHLNQEEDVGFKKNIMLNRSIVESRADMLVFIDGDCIPHRHFVKEYTSNSGEGYFLAGRRCMLGEKTSAIMLKDESLEKLNFLSLLFSDTTVVKESIYSPYFHLSTKTRGLLGCNWGILKQHLLDVNGFDEDYIKPGVGEDNDIEWRLEANGLKKKSIKNKAITYHIYHPRTYSEEGVYENFQMFYKKQEAGHIKCLNGIEKIGGKK